MKMFKHVDGVNEKLINGESENVENEKKVNCKSVIEYVIALFKHPFKTTGDYKDVEEIDVQGKKVYIQK